MKVNTDFIGNNQAQGAIATMLLNSKKLDVGRLRPFEYDGRSYVSIYKGHGDIKDEKFYDVIQVNANSTLRREEWMQLDKALLDISRSRLGGVEDLVSKGLTYNLGNAMATTVLEYHDISDSMEAELSMDGVTRGNADRPEYGSTFLPIPIIHVDFDINARALAASRNMGNPLDTTMVEQAGRKVKEKLEAMLFTDTSYAAFGGTIYSYLNAPKRNTVTSSTVWDDSATGAQILSDVQKMKKASIAAKHYGPWQLYIPTEYETRIDEDYSTLYPGVTIRDRIMKLNNIMGIKIVDTLTDGKVVMVQMTSDVVRLVNGMAMQTVQWKTEGDMVIKFKVMAIQVPQIRNDHDGNSGLTVLTLT